LDWQGTSTLLGKSAIEMVGIINCYMETTLITRINVKQKYQALQITFKRFVIHVFFNIKNISAYIQKCISGFYLFKKRLIPRK